MTLSNLKKSKWFRNVYKATKRQRFLINQGYSYKVINKLGTLANENLYYGKKEEQEDLLKEVLTANEDAAEEEKVPDHFRSGGSSHVFRTTGSMGTLSGADEGFYMEQRRNREQTRHPLFKKFKS